MRHSRLCLDQIRIGIPLPFNAYDEHGTLLLSRGYVLDDVDQVIRLVGRGLFAPSAELAHGTPRENLIDHPAAAPGAHESSRGTRVSIFTLLDEIHNSLERALDTPEPVSLAATISGIASTLQRACRLDADAALASTLLRRKGRYSIRRLVQTAVIVELLMTRFGRDELQRRSAVAAALTRDIAMLALQDVLYEQSTPPSEAQRIELNAHPTRGAELLRTWGVRDEVWIDLVQLHHETIDGTGYPRALSGAAISAEAQILSLADRYGALVSGRAYRTPLLPSHALREIFKLQGSAIEPALVGLLVKEIGIYPPGSIVRLANGDTAVVLKRMPSAHQPVVRSLRTRELRELPDAPRRVTREPMFAVTEAVAEHTLGFPIDPARIWLDTFDVEAN
jgi:HD-GYP domain-containing protein (c-di-GMP phosphodiesterase class II)